MPVRLRSTVSCVELLRTVPGEHPVLFLVTPQSITTQNQESEGIPWMEGIVFTKDHAPHRTWIPQSAFLVKVDPRFLQPKFLEQVMPEGLNDRLSSAYTDLLPIVAGQPYPSWPRWDDLDPAVEPMLGPSHWIKEVHNTYPTVSNATPVTADNSPGDDVDTVPDDLSPPDEGWIFECDTVTADQAEPTDNDPIKVSLSLEEKLVELLRARGPIASSGQAADLLGWDRTDASTWGMICTALTQVASFIQRCWHLPEQAAFAPAVQPTSRAPEPPPPWQIDPTRDRLAEAGTAALLGLPMPAIPAVVAESMKHAVAAEQGSAVPTRTVDTVTSEVPPPRPRKPRKPKTSAESAPEEGEEKPAPTKTKKPPKDQSPQASLFGADDL